MLGKVPRLSFHRERERRISRIREQTSTSRRELEKSNSIPKDVDVVLVESKRHAVLRDHVGRADCGQAVDIDGA